VINDEDNAINCDGGLSDVGSKDDFASSLRGRLEDFGLHIACVFWTYDEFCDFIAECACGLLQVFMCGSYFVLTLRKCVLV
jgi:hypothetical protein